MLCFIFVSKIVCMLCYVLLSYLTHYALQVSTAGLLNNWRWRQRNYHIAETNSWPASRASGPPVVTRCWNLISVQLCT